MPSTWEMRHTPTGRAALAILLALSTAGCDDGSGIDQTGPDFTLETAWALPQIDDGDFLTTIAFDGDGVLWVASFGGTILRISSAGTEVFDAASSIGPGPLNDLFVDARDRAWVAVGTSVAVYEDGSWSPKGPADLQGLAPHVAQVGANAAGEVLLAVGDVDAGGLVLLRDGRWELFTEENSQLQSPVFREIEVDQDGSFWIAGGQWQGRGGLVKLAGGELTVIATDTDLLFPEARDIYLTDDAVHLGFEAFFHNSSEFPEGGIQTLSRDGVVLGAWFPWETGLSSNRVLSLTGTSDGTIWFTTDWEGTCEFCPASVGRLDPGGRIDVLSTANSDLAYDEWLPGIEVSPEGEVYVADARRSRILRVVR